MAQRQHRAHAAARTARLHRGEASGAATAQQPHHHGFRLIVGMMGQGDIPRIEAVCGAIEKPVAQVPGALFHIGASSPGRPQVQSTVQFRAVRKDPVRSPRRGPIRRRAGDDSGGPPPTRSGRRGCHRACDGAHGSSRPNRRRPIAQPECGRRRSRRRARERLQSSVRRDGSSGSWPVNYSPELRRCPNVSGAAFSEGTAQGD